jgi:DNA-binding NarL/FixJ family response regulator
MLRRAAALRLSDDGETAAAVAQRVRERAAEVGDSAGELAACIELGQCLLNAEIGDATTQASSEADFDGAQEAYSRAVSLAEALDDKRMVAGASRELGVIATGRIREWFVDRITANEHIPAMKALLAGVSMEEIVADLPIAPIVAEAFGHFERALNLFEELGDRKGVMSTVVAMAAASWAPGIHLSGSVQHIEEIRRLTARVKSFTRESERALADAQMLFGSHVYSRIRGFPDAALTKGVEAFNAARAIGDRTIEFAAAGGLGLQHAELGAIEEAERWMSRAAAVATASPTPFRALQLELWRGMVRAEAGDVEGMRSRLGQAVAVANEQGRPAARCEALALFATHAARLGIERHDEALMADAERTANEAEALAATLPGHPPWRALAMGARARILLARGETGEAAAIGREAMALLRGAYHEDFHFDALLPAAGAVLAGGTDEERAAVQDHLQLLAAMIAQRVLDDDVRVRWFGGRLGTALRELGGEEVRVLAAHPDSADVLEEGERRLLQLVTEARSNAEIAATLGISEEAAAQQLARLFGKMGVSSRADATALALTGSLV